MKTQWYLGTIKSRPEKVYLQNFEWACGWYWSGGYIVSEDMHCHFDGCFLDRPDSRGHSLGNFFDPWTKLPDYIKEEKVQRISNGAAIWEDLSFFLNDSQYNAKEWWRIKDLFKQFYRLRDAAEVFQYGRHCTRHKRNPAEINLEMAKQINSHIETVIIPEIRKTLNREEKTVLT